MSDAGSTRWAAEARGRASSYDDRWAELAAKGESVHGEADLVATLLAAPPASVLDAGCGTGRVAIELDRRGFEVVGVDLDAGMLDRARAKAGQLRWVQADLAHVDLGRTFDLVVMAGNVMVFLAPGTEAAVVANVARHVRAGGGALVAGFQLDRGLELVAYDRFAADAGLDLAERWATWNRQPYAGGGYAVSVHRRP